MVSQLVQDQVCLTFEPFFINVSGEQDSETEEADGVAINMALIKLIARQEVGRWKVSADQPVANLEWMICGHLI